MSETQIRDGTTVDHDRRLADQPMAVLIRRLSDQGSALMRDEIALAKAELTEEAKRAGAGAGMFGAAALFALLCLGALTAAGILALALVVAPWLAACCVAAACLAIAGIAALLGRGQVRRATPPLPQTVETMKEDVQWTRARMRQARS